MKTIIAAIVFISILIFFHELGHFIFAKLMRVKVLKFSIGFGPRLISKKIGETEYILAAIPLGGYVKPLGEEPGEEISEEDKPRAFNCQPVWKRAAIILAGPAFSFLLAFLIFATFLSLKYPVIVPDLDALNALASNTIDDVMEGSPAMKAGLKIGDTVITINGKSISMWEEMKNMFEQNPGRELVLKVKRGDKVINISVTPELTKIKGKGGEKAIGTIGVSKRTSIIGEVMENSPAMKAGLKNGDSILSIDEASVVNWEKMAMIISRNAGKELKLKIKRGDEIIDIRVIPEPERRKDNTGKEIIVGRIGISGPYYAIQSSSILQAPLKGIEAVYDWSVLTVRVVGRLFTGNMSLKQVGGPLTIGDVAGKAASAGPYSFFNFIAIISINLAILNLLPIPVLDGGHLMFLSVEAVRRKPLSERTMKVVNAIGLSLLLVLIVFVIYNDIMRIVVPWIQGMLSS